MNRNDEIEYILCRLRDSVCFALNKIVVDKILDSRAIKWLRVCLCRDVLSDILFVLSFSHFKLPARLPIFT